MQSARLSQNYTSSQHRYPIPSQYRITVYGGHTTKHAAMLLRKEIDKIQLQQRNLQDRQEKKIYAARAVPAI